MNNEMKYASSKHLPPTPLLCRLEAPTQETVHVLAVLQLSSPNE